MPHVTWNLWRELGYAQSFGDLLDAPWPEVDEGALEQEEMELVLQVNGKVRDRLEVPADLPDEELVTRAKESPKVQAHLDGGEIRQTIVVPRKLVNLVTA